MDVASAQRLHCRSCSCRNILIVLSYLLVLRWCEPGSTKVALFAIGPSRAKARVFLRLYHDYNRTILTPEFVHR